MIEKIFVRDYRNTGDVNIRNRYGNVAGIFGICTNLLLGTVKLAVGFISNSVSIMADAANNISDMATSVITLIGFRLSRKKPDREHPYGFARYEYVTGLLIGVFMFVMGILFAKESFVKILHPQELTISSSTYLILGIALAVKIFQMCEYFHFAKAIDSGTLKATATDSRNDVITSAGILASMVVMGVFKLNIDGYVGFAISVLVIISSVGTVKEALQPIIGIIPTQEQVKALEAKLTSYPAVLGVHDMIIHNYGVRCDFVTVHCEVDASRNICDIHDDMDRIEDDFRTNEGIQLTIHMDPVVIGNPKLDDLKAQVSKALGELDDTLMFHDFRMVDGPTHINVIFDCVVPQNKNYDGVFFNKYLSERVNSDKTVYFVVEIDRPFC